MIVGIHDYDFFHYWNVMPNLECAKLLAYYKKKRDITLLAPTLEPERYNSFFVRKDYEDRLYPKELFLPNVGYGGRAVSLENYVPFSKEIESIVPDFSPYEKYESYFGVDKATFKRILRAGHGRLSREGHSIDSFVEKQLKAQIFPKTSGIILHDYNLGQVEGAVSFLKELSNSRFGVNNPEKIHVLPIGMKFPPTVSTKEELYEWLSLPPLSGIFQVQYEDLMPDKMVKELCDDIPARTARKIIYNPFSTTSCDEQILETLPIVYRQCLYLSTHKINFLLTLGRESPFSQELENLFRLWNEFFQKSQDRKLTTLYYYLKAKSQYNSGPIFTEKSLSPKTSLEENRKSFIYIREKNYELFKMFYETISVHYEKEMFIND